MRERSELGDEDKTTSSSSSSSMRDTRETNRVRRERSHLTRHQKNFLSLQQFHCPPLYTYSYVRGREFVVRRENDNKTNEEEEEDPFSSREEGEAATTQCNCNSSPAAEGTDPVDRVESSFAIP